MSVTRIGAWATNGSYVTQLSGAAQNVPGGALLVTSLYSATGSPGTLSVTDTAGNVYTVLAALGSSARGYKYLAYCLSATANAANVIKWSWTTSQIASADGAAYSTSTGTWSFDKSVTNISAYATPASVTFSTTGAGVIAGSASEYYQDTAAFTNTNVTQAAYVNGSSTTPYLSATEAVENITAGAQTNLNVQVEDNEGGYGGYVLLYLGSFVVAAGGTNTAIGTGITVPVAAGTAQALNSAIATGVTYPSVAGTALQVTSNTAFATGITYPRASAAARALSSAQATGITYPRAAALAQAVGSARATGITYPLAAGSASSIAYALSTGVTTPRAAGSAQGYASAFATGITVPRVAATANQLLPFNTAFATGVLPVPVAAAIAQSVNYALAVGVTYPRASGTGFVFDPNFYVLAPTADFDTTDLAAFYVQAPAMDWLVR